MANECPDPQLRPIPPDLACALQAQGEWVPVYERMKDLYECWGVDPDIVVARPERELLTELLVRGEVLVN